MKKKKSWHRYKFQDHFYCEAIKACLYYSLAPSHNICIYFFLLANDGRTVAPQYRGLGSAFTTIFRQEGFRGLYKGVTPNAWGSGSAWGFYFLL